jgi:hypothetical protein
MPTAIVSIYTPEGFVIAADGRELQMETKTVVNDSVQKIHPVSHPQGELAYSFAGTDKITPRGSGEVMFDFIHETLQATDVLAARRYKSLWHYAEALRDILWPLPEQARQALSTFESSPQETMIFLEGYHDGRPKRVRLTFFNDGLQEPEVSADFKSGTVLGVIPEKVANILDRVTGHGPLAAYRARLNGIETMSEAIKTSQKVVAALKDPEALQIDPRCEGIGGHVHVCKITFTDGFQWIIKPLR